MSYEAADWYSDLSLVDDPHAYFHWLREQGPVVRLPHRNAVAVTGYEETIQVMLDTEHFSEINAVTGGLVALPFTPESDDITEQLTPHRKQIDFADQIVAESGERHANLRSILARLFTPSRLKHLQPKLRATAEALIDEFHGDGQVDIVRQYGGRTAHSSSPTCWDCPKRHAASSGNCSRGRSHSRWMRRGRR